MTQTLAEPMTHVVDDGSDGTELTTADISSSILYSVKKAVGVSPEDECFDADILMHINSVFAELHQLGVGPDEPFYIEDADILWSDFNTDQSLAMVKSYMFLEVRLMFDPPTASLLSALERKRDEYEWRLNVAGDKPLHDSEDGQNGSV